MNKSIVTLASLFAAIAALPVVAHAEDAAPAAAPPASPLTFNIGVVSDYRYRGITQTRYKPALQGGADYTFANGFYVGTWASTIKWIKDNGVKGSVEWDIYGGYRGEVAPGLGFDVGFLEYWYINNKLADTSGGGVYKNANTLEAYGALTYGPITGKVSYALTNLFGNYNFTTNQKSSGSYYFDLSGTFDLGSGFTLVPHLGYQDVEHIPNASYTDYSVTVSKDLGSGFSVSLAAVGTDAKKSFYVTPVNGKFLGKNSAVVGLKYAC